jgi:hypothetical protein
VKWVYNFTFLRVRLNTENEGASLQRAVPTEKEKTDIAAEVV